MLKLEIARPSSRLSAFAQWVLAASLYFLLAASTVDLTSNGRTIATVWPANAVLVAFLWLDRRPRWSAIISAGVVANIAANWLTRGTIAGPLLYSLANVVEVVLAVTLARSRDGTADALQSTRGLLRFFWAAGVVAPLVSAVVGAGVASGVFAQPFGTAFTTWYLSDALGLLVFTPVFMAVFSGELAGCFRDRDWWDRTQALGVLAIVAATATAIFFVAALPFLYLLYAPVMLATFRIGSLGTKMAVMIIALIGAVATAAGHGPVVMITADPVRQALLFQIFLAVVLLSCLPVAAGISEQRRLARELAQRERESWMASITDPLTGLLNRRGLSLRADETLSNGGGGICCVAIDVDRFKDLNDRWGHAFGDAVLCHLATTMNEHTRPGDLVVRLGGDEFVLLLRVEERRLGELVCARIEAALRQHPLSPNGQVRVLVGISSGIAMAEPGDRFDDLFARADAALYAMKRMRRAG